MYQCETTHINSNHQYYINNKRTNPTYVKGAYDYRRNPALIQRLSSLKQTLGCLSDEIEKERKLLDMERRFHYKLSQSYPVTNYEEFPRDHYSNTSPYGSLRNYEAFPPQQYQLPVQHPRCTLTIPVACSSSQRAGSRAFYESHLRSLEEMCKAEHKRMQQSISNLRKIKRSWRNMNNEEQVEGCYLKREDFR